MDAVAETAGVEEDDVWVECSEEEANGRRRVLQLKTLIIRGAQCRSLGDSNGLEYHHHCSAGPASAAAH